MAGNICRSLAAAALLLTKIHQSEPSMGPAWRAVRKLGGIRESSDRSLRLDSCISEVNCASVGESCAACSNDWAWLCLLIGCVRGIIRIIGD
jgi:hypothetical protein